ncbi:hypothetical protein Tco_0649068 [Tanacetum coccineum]
MDYHHLFTEFNVGTARQACLNAEVRMRTEYCLSKRRRLESECEKQADFLKARDAKVESLKAQLLLKETEAAKEKESLDGKVTELQSSVSTKDLELKDLNVSVPLADAPRINDLQPNVDQLMLPIYRSEDQVVLGETSLSFALSVTHYRVERIKENVAAKRSALIVTIATTTALSTTFASASSIPPITIEYYEIVGTDGPKDAQGNGRGNVAPFPTIEFEKEELDTTPELIHLAKLIL